MNNLLTHIYTSGDQLPEGLLNENFFHSRELFELGRQTPRQRPYLVTVEDSEGRILSQLLALVRFRSSLFPPYFYMHCRVLGEGAYRLEDGSEVSSYGHATSPTEQECERNAELFGMMLQALRERMSNQVLYIEVSNLSQKMFGYRDFRQNGFFPVKWMSIHNSLHSRTPEERIGKDLMKRIQHAAARGVTTKEVETEAEFKSFMSLLRHHNWLKPRRYIPADEFFHQMIGSKHGKLFITQHHQFVIGCSTVVFSQGQAFLWYSAFRRKSFAALHPADITLWNAIQYAHQQGYEHIYFMDVGLPFRKNLYRDFILRFGGKPVSTLRWFRFSIGWLNRLLSWIYI
jgi:hypothetical protein